MARTLLAQTLGSALLPTCLASAQAALRLLDAFPSSATAWYLNLAVFAPLQQARAIPSLLATFLDRAGMMELCLVLLLMAAVQIARFRLGVAILVHMAFAASLLIAQAWVMDLHGAMAARLLLTREASGTALVAILLIATGFACALSHVSFIRDILRSEIARDGGRLRREEVPRGGAVLAILSPATRVGV